MKHILLITILALGTLAASAAVPLHWTVETSRAVPAQFEAYQGETLALEAALQSYGKPLEAPSNYSLYWQTNGMGSTYWSVPVQVPSSSTGTGTSHSNLMYATWSPTNDVGAKVYNCFIGKPGTIYHAAFQLRLRPSPGATPNELPLPQKVIDFAKVTVLNPPWSGGGGGVNTNTVIDIIHKTVDGAARPLPKYLHALDFADSYTNDAAAYYRSRGDGKVDGGCSSVRAGGFLHRNFDYPFDDRAEFVVKMSAGPGRFASVGVSQVGTNLTEQMVKSGKWSKWYKALPGATVDGINENGVACNINVVGGDPQTSGWHNDTGDLRPLAAVRWILDNATNAEHAATYIASHISFPEGWTQNFHYMIADATSTYIVENGDAHHVPSSLLEGAVMTNFRLYPTRGSGEGQERYDALASGENITSQWWTLTYTPTGYRASDLPGITGESLTNLFNYFENNPRESHRGETFPTGTGTENYTWWQTVHTSIYDITNRVLRVAVQETDDWYTFQVPSSGAKIDAYTKAETDAAIAANEKEGTNEQIVRGEKIGIGEWSIVVLEAHEAGHAIEANNAVLDGDGNEITSTYATKEELAGKLDKTDVVDPDDFYDIPDGKAADARQTGRFIGTLRELKANRPNDFDETHAGNIATLKENGDLADSEKKPSDFRETTDNTCHRTEFVEWKIHGLTVGHIVRGPFWNENRWFVTFSAAGGTDDEDAVGVSAYDPNATELSFNEQGYEGEIYISAFTATRSAVCTSNELFTTQGYVDGKLDGPTFSNAVLAVAVSSLSTNITAEVYIAATNACANLGIDPALIPGEGTIGTVGGFIAMLFAVVFWMRKKIFDNSGKVNDAFAGELLGKPVAKSKLQTIEDEPTVTSGAVTLKDGAASTVAIGSLASLDITFDEARNGGLRLCELYITGVTAETIPDLTFDAATVSFVATGDSFPACEAGINYFVFAEVAANLWKVTRETLKSITTPTPVAAA